jgi:hypothetical protein
VLFALLSREIIGIGSISSRGSNREKRSTGRRSSVTFVTSARIFGATSSPRVRCVVVDLESWNLWSSQNSSILLYLVMQKNGTIDLP